MRSVSMPWFMGLVVSIVGCSGSGGAADTAAEATGAAPAPETSSDVAEAPAQPGAADEEEASPASGGAGDGGAPASPGAPDGGAADAGSTPGKTPIPMPVPAFGKIHATASTGETCAFTVDGFAKGTSTVLDVTVYVGWHAVACKRADGVVASENVQVEENSTTNVVLAMPAPPVANGTLVAVAVDGTCAFSVDGSAKGTTSTLKLSLPPKTYLVTCKPTTGGSLKSRSVTIASGETAMAMFKLSE